MLYKIVPVEGGLDVVVHFNRLKPFLAPLPEAGTSDGRNSRTQQHPRSSHPETPGSANWGHRRAASRMTGPTARQPEGVRGAAGPVSRPEESGSAPGPSARPEGRPYAERAARSTVGPEGQPATGTSNQFGHRASAAGSLWCGWQTFVPLQP